MQHTPNLAEIMRRAWEIFRQTYNYPRVPFHLSGRRCFASALRTAWREAREAADLAATSTDALARLAATYTEQLDGLRYRGWGTNTDRARETIRSALRPIEAELARREPIPQALAA